MVAYSNFSGLLNLLPKASIVLVLMCIFSCSSAFAEGKNEPVWKEPLPGTVAFLGDDGGGADTATVCDTDDHVESWLNNEGSSGCRSFSHGLHVVIEQVGPMENSVPAATTLYPLVKIKIPSKNFVGYVQLFEGIHPIIPAGAIIHLKQEGNETLMLTRSQDADEDSGLNLGEEATAKVVRYDPTTGDRNLYVTVIDGKFAGSSGWVFSLDGNGDDGDPLDIFAQALVDAPATNQTAVQNSAPPTDSSSTLPAPGSSTIPVDVGSRGEINGPTIACQDKQDILDFEKSYAQSSVANDSVGKSQAISTALNASCKMLQAGDTGLVIDISGFFEAVQKIRMDSDQTAYWVDPGFVSPIPAQFSNP